VAVTGNGTGELSLSGTLTALNAALDGLHYAPASGATADQIALNVTNYVPPGSGRVSIFLGSFGLTLALDSNPNLQPTIPLPAAASVSGGAVLVFSEANANAIHVADGDSAGNPETGRPPGRNRRP